MAGCPLSEINLKNMPVPIQPAPPKTTSPDFKKKVPPLTIITTNPSSKTIAYVTSGRSVQITLMLHVISIIELLRCDVFSSPTAFKNR